MNNNENNRYSQQTALASHGVVSVDSTDEFCADEARERGIVTLCLACANMDGIGNRQTGESKEEFEGRRRAYAELVEELDIDCHPDADRVAY